MFYIKCDTKRKHNRVKLEVIVNRLNPWIEYMRRSFDDHTYLKAAAWYEQSYLLALCTVVQGVTLLNSRWFTIHSLASFFSPLQSVLANGLIQSRPVLLNSWDISWSCESKDCWCVSAVPSVFLPSTVTASSRTLFPGKTQCVCVKIESLCCLFSLLLFSFAHYPASDWTHSKVRCVKQWPRWSFCQSPSFSYSLVSTFTQVQPTGSSFKIREKRRISWFHGKLECNTGE